MPCESIRNPASMGTVPRVARPSPPRTPLALEAMTAREIARQGRIPGVDIALDEYPLGWGEFGLIGVVDVSSR